MLVFREFMVYGVMAACYFSVLVPIYCVNFGLWGHFSIGAFVIYDVCLGIFDSFVLIWEIYKWLTVLFNKAILGRAGMEGKHVDNGFWKGAILYGVCIAVSLKLCIMLRLLFGIFNILFIFVTCWKVKSYVDITKAVVKKYHDAKSEAARKFVKVAVWKIFYCALLQFLFENIFGAANFQEGIRNDFETFITGGAGDVTGLLDVVWDVSAMTVVSCVIFPGVLKLMLLPAFGDFSTYRQEKGNCSRATCCELGERAYRFHHVAFVGYFAGVFRNRMLFMKLLLVLGAMLSSSVCIVKDLWYSAFHFGVRCNSAMMISELRSRRVPGSKPRWQINDAEAQFKPMSNMLWAIVLKYSVDSVPSWARCAYAYCVDYPFAALQQKDSFDDDAILKLRNCQIRKLAILMKKGKQQADPVTIGYYSLAGFHMRVSEMPGFILTDDIGTVHYRRYLRISQLPGFDKYIALWLLGDRSAEGIENQVGLDNIMTTIRDCKEVTVLDSPINTPMGKVPFEQMIQFRFVAAAFQWRSHLQMAVRQTAKIQIYVYFLLAFSFCIFLRYAALHPSLVDLVCAVTQLKETPAGAAPHVAELDNGYGWCRCGLAVTSGGLGLVHIVKISGFLLVDVVESVALCWRQKQQVDDKCKPLVLDMGALGKRNQIQWVNIWFTAGPILALQLHRRIPQDIYRNGVLREIYAEHFPECKGIFYGY